MKKNNYWEKYKLKYKSKWNFNPLSKTKDYNYIGRVKTNFKQIDDLINKLEKIKKIESGVQKNPVIKNKKVIAKINSYKSWGYNRENTKFYRAISKDHEKIFKKYIKLSKLDMAASSIIKQLPGQTIPWHQDNHFDFVRKMKAKGIIVNRKKIIRYMIFLTDWDYGHFFCVGSSIVEKWRKGDIITWDPHIHHCGCNGGMKPKVTMNITGIVNNKSIHRSKKKVFFI